MTSMDRESIRTLLEWRDAAMRTCQHLGMYGHENGAYLYLCKRVGHVPTDRNGEKHPERLDGLGEWMPENEHELPEGATALIALARVAHRDGNRQLEQAALGKLARDFGMAISFPCCKSVDKDLAAIAGVEHESG